MRVGQTGEAEHRLEVNSVATAQLPLPPLPVAHVRPARIAHGCAIGHNGEILQGVFEQSDGRLIRGLVSLATAVFRSEAVFRPTTHGPLRIEPSWKVKVVRAAELTLAHCGSECSGVLTIANNMVPRWGLGSSTSDVVAAVRAVARSLGRSLLPEDIAAIAVRSETACDSVMFGHRAVLFAQRRGIVIEDLGGQLPPVHVIGFNTDPTGWGVDTLKFRPARYTWWEIEAFRPLLGLLRNAVQNGDAHALGQVASASARINQRHLPKPHFDNLEEIAERCGGLGMQVAHSGSVVGILLPADDSTRERSEAVRRYLMEIGIGATWAINTRNDGSE